MSAAGRRVALEGLRLLRGVDGDGLAGVDTLRVGTAIVFAYP
jgi:hypothetical protein